MSAGPYINFDFIVAIGSTVTDVVAAFANAALLDEQGVVLFDIRYLPVAPPVSLSQLSQTVIRLEAAYVETYVKMDLKMQNRTVFGSGANDDVVDDVANQPLYGKSYSGVGLGPRPRGATVSQGFTANVNTGIIAFGASSAGTPFNEPLDYQYYQNVNKIGKIHMDGGQLKTSVISKRAIFQFGNLMNMINRQLNDAGSTTAPADKSYIPKKLAEYKMYAAEKMIDAGATGFTPTVVLMAWEHNVKISARIKTVKQNSTAISFIKNRI